MPRQPHKFTTTEQQEQIAALNWLRLTYPDVYEMTFSIPNEGKTSIYAGLMLKKSGMRAGFPDLGILWPMKWTVFHVDGDHEEDRQSHGLFIEMKTMRGKMRPNQQEWQDKLNAKGYEAHTCYSCDEFIMTVTGYLSRKLYV